MFIFNTTFSVETTVLSQWQEWMSKNYFPALIDLVPAASHETWKVALTGEDGESSTFSCQWRCNTPDELAIINKYSTILLSNLSGIQGEKCLYFSTILQKSDLF